MSNVEQQINAVERTIGSRVLPAGQARVSVISQTYRAPIDDVWDACTNAERIPRWFLPISGDLHVGGRYQLEGNASGEILTCEKPARFTATWEYGGEVSWIEVRLTEQPGGTRFELEHVAHVSDDLWGVYGPGATGIGWDMGVLGLASHLGFGSAVAPADAAAWMGTPEGKQFMTLSGERWRDASIAAGTDIEQANAAAARCLAAYLGEEDAPS